MNYKPRARIKPEREEGKESHKFYIHHEYYFLLNVTSARVYKTKRTLALDQLAHRLL